jgi:hypothetical protein
MERIQETTMSRARLHRRKFLKSVGLASAAAALSGRPLSGRAVPGVPLAGGEPVPEGHEVVSVDPRPLFDLSPYLYMQFMEPLGTTDSSVDAAWDFNAGRWREDVVEITQVLSPTLIRWGGCFASYYRWQEGVGPRGERPPMVNLLWGGIYNNQVGTHELVDLCRRTGADPLIVVNFESDGRGGWAHPPKGGVRSGDAREAAEWVAYCNDPSSELRIRHGAKDPLAVKLWQIGNETSYDPDGFDVETAARKTLEFAKAMRRAGPGIEIIGWGDSGWASRMAEVAGEELQYLAFHGGFGPGGGDSPLRGIEYRKDPAKTWETLMATCEAQERRIAEMRTQVAPLKIPLALTECHFFLPGRNRGEVLSSWAAGVANARILNVHERNGDILKIATLADFCGTRWQNNAVMIPVPGGRSFLMPVALVMGLYRKHGGDRAAKVLAVPKDLDVVASRTAPSGPARAGKGERIFLHVVNTSRTRSVKSAFRIDGRAIAAGRVHWYDLEPELEIFEYRPEHTFPREAALDRPWTWTFPAASVSAVELTLEPV